MTEDDIPPSNDKHGGLDDPSWVDQIVARAMQKAEAAAAAGTRVQPGEGRAARPRSVGEIAAAADATAAVEPASTPDEPIEPESTGDVTAEAASEPTAEETTTAAADHAAVAAGDVITEPEVVADPAPEPLAPSSAGSDTAMGEPPTEESWTAFEEAPAPDPLSAPEPTLAASMAEADGASAGEVDLLVATTVDSTPGADVAEGADLADQIEELEEDDEGSRMRSIIEWGAVIVGALAVAFLIKTFLLQAFFIPSGSMEPTLAIGDRVLVNKLSYDFHDVRRGDLIVFERPENVSGSVPDLIKRVIALSGEEIDFRDGTIYIDNRRLVEPYLPEGNQTSGLSLTPTGQEVCGGQDSCTVPDGYVFVMGDNRADSSDSRRFGPIEESSIVGRAFFRVWPLNHIGFL